MTPSYSVGSTHIWTEKSSGEICTNSSNGLKSGKCRLTQGNVFPFTLVTAIRNVITTWTITSLMLWRKRKTWEQITYNLKPVTQCQQAYTKASRALGLIARTISYKSPAVLLKLYKTLVWPHVEYCVSAWSPYYVKDKALLEHIQHRFTRMVPGLKSLPYEERLDCLDFMDIRRKKELCRYNTGVQALQGMVIYSIWSLLHSQYCYKHSRSYCKD